MIKTKGKDFSVNTNYEEWDRVNVINFMVTYFELHIRSYNKVKKNWWEALAKRNIKLLK